MTLAVTFPPALLLVLLGGLLLFSGPTTGGGSGQAGVVKRESPLEPRGASVLWTDQQIAGLKSLKLENTDSEAKIDFAKPKMPSLEERVRFGTSEVWRPKIEAIRSQDLKRPRAPLKGDYDTAQSSYLQSPLAGEFSAGSDRIFVMYKTGADTMWKRGVPHFMTTFPKYVNIALYSDTAGSMFGYEVHDILDGMPLLAHTRQGDFARYRAHKQMHDEKWGWEPSKVQADGGWTMDKFKNLPVLYDAYMRNPNCDWYVMMDDDSYMLHDNLVRYLSAIDHNQIYYTGNPGNHWVDDHGLPFAHGGSVIVCSRGLVDALFGPNKVPKEDTKELLEKWAKRTIDMCCGDIALGECIWRELDHEMDVPKAQRHHLVGIGGPFQSTSLSSLVVVDGYMCNPLITFHHLEGSDMETLYEYERLWKEDRYITYNDYYRDFVLPYIVEERPNWKLDADHIDEWFRPDGSDGQEHVSLWAGGHEWHPGQSKTECKDACTAYNECAAWSWRDGHCIHSDHGLILGRAANSFSEEEHWVTGYLVDRIRDWRHKAPCDPLHKDENGNWNDDESTSEGWYLRALAAAKDTERYTYSLEDSTVPGLKPKIEPPTEPVAPEFDMPVFAPPASTQ